MARKATTSSAGGFGVVRKFDLARDISGRSVPGSTVSPHRLAWSRTPPFHGENRGSNPRGDAS
jgi:hypothetical protein